MWNDRDLPLGYLITFRCYGTWLHGDERGSVDRFHNLYKSPYIPRDDKWHRHNERHLKAEPVILDSGRRRSVTAAIIEVCEYRRWLLHAANVRTNHVHVVTSIGPIKPERALNSLKAYATRRMRRDRTWRHDHSPWLDKGSIRYLWTERSLAQAIDYVKFGQGDELPDFD